MLYKLYLKVVRKNKAPPNVIPNHIHQFQIGKMNLKCKHQNSFLEKGEMTESDKGKFLGYC